MASTKQQSTARPSMARRARTRAQPKGGARKAPGATGRGAFYHVEVRPKREFETFRTQDVGSKGGIERVAGKRTSGSWDTVKWLIAKDHAHVRNGRLVADSEDARKVLETLGAVPVHVRGDRFEAKDRPNVPERAKPTAAQQRAQRRNIGKAQAARRKAR
jgi:hypothetical protein